MEQLGKVASMSKALSSVLLAVGSLLRAALSKRSIPWQATLRDHATVPLVVPSIAAIMPVRANGWPRRMRPVALALARLKTGRADLAMPFGGKLSLLAGIPCGLAFGLIPVHHLGPSRVGPVNRKALSASAFRMGA